jgi:hypothetical protein
MDHFHLLFEKLFPVDDDDGDDDDVSSISNILTNVTEMFALCSPQEE